MAPRYLDAHKWKNLDNYTKNDQKQIVGRFLNLQNKMGLTYLRPEYEGMVKEKEDAKLQTQDTRNKLVMGKHELEMT